MTKRPAFEKVTTDLGDLYVVQPCDEDEVICDECHSIIKEVEAFCTEDEDGHHVRCADCVEVQ